MNRQPAPSGAVKPPAPTPVPSTLAGSLNQLFKAVSFVAASSRNNGHK